MRLPATATPVSEDESAALLLAAWPAMTRPQAELLLAMLWLENARGRAVIQGNWGNLSAAVPVDGDAPVNYWRPPWYDAAEIETIADPARRDRMRALHARMLAHQAPSAFLAFASPAVGMARWVSRMQTRFASLARVADTGDAKAFAEEQVRSGYCPDCGRTNYGSLRDQIHKRGYFAALPAGSGSSGGSGVAVLMCLLLGGLALWQTRA